jgi:hypothetical protein
MNGRLRQDLIHKEARRDGLGLNMKAAALPQFCPAQL